MLQGKGMLMEEALTNRIISLACQYGRYGYRRVTALLRSEGRRVNHKFRRDGFATSGTALAPGRLESAEGTAKSGAVILSQTGPAMGVRYGC